MCWLERRRLARGRLILIEDLQTPPAVAEAPAAPSATASNPFCLKEILAETERRVIAEALAESGWNRTRASQLLGISRRQLFDKIRQYELQE